MDEQEPGQKPFLHNRLFTCSPYKEVPVPVLTDPEIIDEQFNNIIQENEIIEALSILIDVAGKQEITVPNEALEKLIIFLDPDYSGDINLVNSTLEFLSELSSYKNSNYRTYLSNPTVIDFASEYFPSEASTKFLVSVLKLNPNVWQRFFDNGLISKIIQDLQSETPNFNCTIPILTQIPSDYDSSQLAGPLINLLQADDDNVVSDTLAALTNLCKQNLSICNSLLSNSNFLNLYSNDNFDDLLIGDFIEIAKAIVTTTCSCTIFRVEEVFNFMLMAITENRDVDEAVRFIYQTSNTEDFSELSSNQELYEVLSSVIDSDAKYKVRTEAAVAITHMVILSTPSFIDPETLISQYEGIIDGKADDFVILCLAAILSLSKIRGEVIPAVASCDTLMSVINESVDSTNLELAEIATQLLNLLEEV